jgi:hypothetical protein
MITYYYSRGNPVKYNDPTGHYIETGIDLISLGMTVNDIRVNGWSWGNGIGLVADVASLALPGIAGGGWIVKAISKIDDVGDATRAVNAVGDGFGTWQRYNEVVDPSVVRQAEGNWCAIACGEMLTNGRVTQHDISKVISISAKGTVAEDIANVLNTLDPAAMKSWQGGYIGAPTAEAAFNWLNAKGSWGAQMFLGAGNRHMVIVDGINDAGMVMVRDPWEGTRYNMAADEFMNHWEQIALFAD